MKLVIQKTSDFLTILQLNEEIFPGEDLEVSKRVSAWIARDRNTGKLVGFCTSTDYGGGIFFLSRAGVLPEYQGNGIQRRLITVRELHARRSGVKKLITYVARHNYKSLANLIKSGFLIYDPEYAYVGEKFIYLIKYLP